ncbi:CYTH and CHAD domain-containing protein [Methylobacterium sp. J-076]|uniref:CYTH and CHAD domain-containing protein n=1 Tax=Methylobacterium sp. J-076 TaxID=2836655 RepID=UPI001FBAB1D0|nr:CYTH and CHAD domain-containing protein [Methylobacterium sp. J-076]MCJ2014213.1 CHAD domain-containing protein [Methylobacterium sp. J-076]
MSEAVEGKGEPREIELKLDCGGPDLTALSGHPLLKDVAATEPKLLLTTYFDTPGRALKEAGLTLRIRSEGGRYVQTVKAGSGQIGLFDRAEWESDVAGDSPDPAAWAGTAAEPVLAGAGTELAPLFTTLIERRVHPVSYGESRILVTLDEGRVECASGDSTLCEVELEIESGGVADLFAFAQALAETVPLRLGVLSKSARGFAVLDREVPTPCKAGAVDLSPDADAGTVFRTVARSCLRHLRLNETAFLDGPRDPSALHQMRVALRRLRSALSLCAPLFEGDPKATALADEIKRVTEPFGEARNLDVFLHDTLPVLAEHNPGDPALDAVSEKAKAARERAYLAVQGILASPQWRGLLLDIAGWVEVGPWSEQDAARQDGRHFAAGILDKARRRVKKRGKGLRHLDAHTRHRARISAKKLRYGAEFFADLFPKPKAQKRQKAFGDALSELQDHLGALNDIETVRHLPLGLADEGGPAMPEVDEKRVKDLLDKAADARADLLDVKPFWR